MKKTTAEIEIPKNANHFEEWIYRESNSRE